MVRSPGDTRELQAFVHFTPVETVVLTQPWDTRTQTVVVRPARGARVVVQWSNDRRGMGRRIRIGYALAQRARSIPTAEVLDGNARAVVPFMVSTYVPGESGVSLLGGDDEATILLGRRMGALARDLRLVPTTGLRLPKTWADDSRLAAAARRWMGRAADLLEPTAMAAIDRLIERLPLVFAGRHATFAHGDLAPVNVLLRAGVLVALLDLERARIAHPLFDAAWFRLIVRTHHPERWRILQPTFLRAAGIAESPDVWATLDLLAVLQCLESIDGLPRSQAPFRSEWASRALTVLDQGTESAPD